MAEEQKNRSVQRNQVSGKALDEARNRQNGSTNIYHVGHALIIEEAIEEEYVQIEEKNTDRSKRYFGL